MRTRMKNGSIYKSPLPVILIAAALAGTTAAQTTTTPTAPPEVKAFNIERSLPLSSLNSTLTPNVPASVQAGLQSGANELRESVNYSPDSSLLTINLFTVQTGAPLPTPSNVNTAPNTFSTILVKVDKVYIAAFPTGSSSSSGPGPNDSVMFVGTVASNGPVSPFGNLTGAPVAVSVGFTGDTPPKITDVVTLIAGTVVEFGTAAQGTLTFTSSPIGPPTTSGSGIQVVIKAPTSTASNFIALDASGTTGGTAPLKYSWAVTSGNATIFNASNAVATAQLFNVGLDYTFEVTVTDAKGNTAKQTVTVRYD